MCLLTDVCHADRVDRGETAGTLEGGGGGRDGGGLGRLDLRVGGSCLLLLMSLLLGLLGEAAL